MNRLSALLAPPLFAALALPAAAQAVPEEARADAWCGVLFALLVGDMPADPAPEKAELAGIFLEASVVLLDRAAAAHAAAGFPPARTRAYVEGVEQTVRAEAASGTMAFAFEDCTERAGLSR